ncbi:SPOR domain-containing protein [Pseudomonadota bacterium]
MVPIEITRVELRWLIAGLITVPFIVFLAGFYIGSTHQGISQNLELSSQEEPSPEPLITENTENTENIENKLPLPVPALVSAPAPVSVPELSNQVKIPKAIDEKTESKPTMPVEVIALEGSTIELDEVGINQMPSNLFAVQVGNFSNSNNAADYQKWLHVKGINARVLGNTTSDGKPTYRVIIGLFTNETAARSAAKQHKHQKNQDAYVAVLY